MSIKAECDGCKRPYGDEHGFPDLIIELDAWRRISPTRDDGGLLCPSCICERLHAQGIKCVGSFMSGPIQSVDRTTMWTKRMVENILLREEARAGHVGGAEKQPPPHRKDMTINRMALVPREATEDMASDGVVAAFQAARNNDAKMPEQAKAVYDAMTYAAPNGGKVSREKVTRAAKAAAALRWPDLGKTVGLDVDVCEDVARAVIEALGLEVEE